MSIAIYYATVTGNSQEAAESIQSAFAGAGKTASIASIADINVNDLKDVEKVVIVSSTFGDGEPPMDAENFYTELKESDIDLSHLKYAVFGLGESFYDMFCQTAIDFDAFLAEKGATRVLDVEKADGDAEPYLQDWMPKALAAF